MKNLSESEGDSTMSLPAVASASQFTASRHRSTRLVTAVFLLAAFALAAYQTRPPKALGADAPPVAFSAARAMGHVEALAAHPRSVESPGHTAAQAYLVNTLSRLGLKAEIQVTPMQARRTPVQVRNIAARVPGSDPSRAILLSAHYDSVPAGPGAGDNAVGVAVLLETARALLAGPPVKNDVIFLFTDAEEIGLLGAQAFRQEHPWARDVGLVINFDNRGTAGPAYLFEISDAHGQLLAEFAASTPYPLSNSLTYDLVRHNPVGTDVQQLKRIPEAAYLNFSFGARWQNYHNPADNLANVDPASVQHEGEYALGLARRLGDKRLPLTATSNAVWFNAFRWVMVRYPVSWALPLAAITVLGLAGVCWVGLRRTRLSFRGLVKGAVAFLAVLIAGVGGAVLIDLAVYSPKLSHADLFPPLFAAVAGAAALLTYKVFARSTGLADLWAGGAFAWAAVAVTTAALVPGASYLFTLPVLLVLPGLLYTVVAAGGEQPTPRNLAVWSVSALPAISLLVPAVVTFYSGLPDMPQVPTALLSFLLGLLVPHLLTLLGRRRAEA